jgi:HEAT repeat protein
MKPYLLVAGISLAVLLNLLHPFCDRRYAMADAESPSNPEAGADAVKKLLSPDADTIDAGIDEIKAERKTQIDALLPIVDVANKSKYRERTRAAAAYLLGEFRAPEALETLVKALEDGDLGPNRQPRMDRLSSPFWEALVKIGRPSVPALLDVVQKTDDKDTRFLTLMALDHILGGKAHVAETLAKLKAKAVANDAPGAQEKAARLDAAIQELQVKFTEAETPLY